MGELLSIIKIISIIQLCLIALLILSIFLYKAYVEYSHNHRKKFTAKVENLFKKYIESTTDINAPDLKIIRSNLIELLSIMKRFNQSHKANPHWQKVKNNLLIKLLWPKARQNSTKRHWHKRYFAMQVFEQGFQDQDIEIIQRLLADSVPLVALNAAKIAITTTSETLILALIRSFSGNRLLQNALFIQIVEPNPLALSLIVQHLNQEKDIYTRVFCYQLLSNNPHVTPEEQQLIKDMDSDNIDLQIAALNCYGLTNPQNVRLLFAEKIQNKHWEIRAKIAWLIGKTNNRSMCSLLENSLKDESWWVRMNAAEALYQLGTEGIQILKKQKPEEDRFAYEVAARVLATKEE
jgi:hypothetical protein